MGELQIVCRDLKSVTVRTLDDVLKPSVPTEAAKQAMQLLALHEALSRTDEGSKQLAFSSGGQKKNEK